uniref:Uncharacterized protein n=1 Tax=Arundo donax TaxID=35708 RepID=A0A0A9GFL7_ARUDO
MGDTMVRPFSSRSSQQLQSNTFQGQHLQQLFLGIIWIVAVATWVLEVPIREISITSFPPYNNDNVWCIIAEENC